MFSARRIKYIGSFFAAIMLLSGCRSISGSYQSTRHAPVALYCDAVKRSIDYEGPERYPIIFIHGLMGAQLRDAADGGNVVWGRFALWEMLAGKNFKSLALNLNADAREQLPGTIRPAGLLTKSVIQLLLFRFHMDNYEPLIQLLKRSGYVPDNEPLPEDKNFYSLFIFYYDWRLSIADNARRLGDFIRSRREYLKKRYHKLYGLKNHPVRFDIIGHSMGGLIARYYVQYGTQVMGRKPWPLPQLDWSGAKDVRKVVIAGTPNAGYSDTFIELQHGLQLMPLAPVYPPAVIGTFPSYYQMLPDSSIKAVRYADNNEPVDIFDIRIWEKYRWGMLSEDPAHQEMLAKLLPDDTPEMRRQKVRRYLEYMLDSARRFKILMRRDAKKVPSPVRFYLFAGDGMLTNQHIFIDRTTGKILRTEKVPGDGKVSSTSARFDLRDGGDWQFRMYSPIQWQAVKYFPAAHMGIIVGDVFMDDLNYILMIEP